jgi:hypothetical protein
MAWVAGIAGLTTMTATLFAWMQRYSDAQPLVALLAALWAIIPPIWFWYDYFVLFKPYAPATAHEYFRHGQQLSAAIWASITLTLAAMSSSDLFKVERHPQRRGCAEAYCEGVWAAPSAPGLDLRLR